MPLAHSFVSALGLLVAAIDLAALGLGSMALAVTLTLDHLATSWIPTKTLLLGSSSGGGRRAGGCAHDFIDDIFNLLAIFFFEYCAILFGRCHLLWGEELDERLSFEVEESKSGDVKHTKGGEERSRSGEVALAVLALSALRKPKGAQ